MAVSVIISNLNGAKYLRKLLGSLAAQQGVTLQIIVVDRLSKDESAQILAEHPEVQVVSEPPESGLVTGYSIGARHARHEHLFFCNEDMWFSSDCLQLLERQLVENEGGRVGAVMPVQLSYDGSRNVNIGAWFTRARWYRGNPYPFRETIGRSAEKPQIVSGINAGACMLTRAAYDDIGGWDTSFFLDFEDFDLSIRLWQRGWTCRIEPRALVYHAVGASNAQAIHSGRSTVARKRYVAALSNELVIVLKHFTGWATMLAPALFLDRMARDVGRMRAENTRLDVEAAWLTLRRLPDVLRYRQSHRTWRDRPGQAYFRDERFDVANSDTTPAVEPSGPAVNLANATKIARGEQPSAR